MTERIDEIRVEIVADLAEMDRLSALAEEFCALRGLPHELALRLILVIEELLTNLATHGRRDDGSRPNAAIVLGRAEGTVRMVFEDDGRAFDPTVLTEFALDDAVEDRPVGGLGIFLVRHMMDEVTHARVGDRNQLLLLKRL